MKKTKGITATMTSENTWNVTFSQKVWNNKVLLNSSEENERSNSYDDFWNYMEYQKFYKRWAVHLLIVDWGVQLAEYVYLGTCHVLIMLFTILFVNIHTWFICNKMEKDDEQLLQALQLTELYKEEELDDEKFHQYMYLFLLHYM